MNVDRAGGWQLLAERLLKDGPHSLSSEEIRKLLNNDTAMSWLHRTVWSRHFREIHPIYQAAMSNY